MMGVMLLKPSNVLRNQLHRWNGLLGVVAILLIAGCGTEGSDPTTTGDLTFYDDIQPIYAKYCSECHWGTSPDGCQGETCFSNHYEGLLFPGATFGREDMNKAEVGLFRIDETNKLGPNINPDNYDVVLLSAAGAVVIVPEKETELIRTWINNGMPEGVQTKPLAPQQDVPSTECSPNCDNKECGDDDGCGGICCEGPPPCEPKCEGKSCGSDGCGGNCPDICTGVCDWETGVCTDENSP